MPDQWSGKQQSPVIRNLPEAVSCDTSVDTSPLPVVMLGMSLTSLNLRQGRSHARTLGPALKSDDK